MTVNEIWVEKYRPSNLDDIILSEENRKYFSSLTSIANNYLFVGPPGTGKNTLAYYLKNRFAPESYLYINASSESGIDIVRNKITDFVSTTSWDGNKKLVILSEFDGFSMQGQQALREVMEQYLEDVRFILTGNYKHKIITAIQSRCQTFDFQVDISDVARRIVHILKAEKISNWQDEKKNINILIKKFFPDIRKTINELQRACATGQFIARSLGSSDFAEQVWDKLKIKESPFTIRKYVMDNDDKYNNDYHQLMRNMFDCAVKDDNVSAALVITDYMYRHHQVMDQEINFIGMIIKLGQLK